MVGSCYVDEECHFSYKGDESGEVMKAVGVSMDSSR